MSWLRERIALPVAVVCCFLANGMALGVGSALLTQTFSMVICVVRGDDFKWHFSRMAVFIWTSTSMLSCFAELFLFVRWLLKGLVFRNRQESYPYPVFKYHLAAAGRAVYILERYAQNCVYS